jgi:hypothetical protein
MLTCLNRYGDVDNRSRTSLALGSDRGFGLPDHLNEHLAGFLRGGDFAEEVDASTFRVCYETRCSPTSPAQITSDKPTSQDLC